MEDKTVSEIASEMAQDIRSDIYGDIYGHESWAEQIFNLRTELRQMKEQANEVITRLRTKLKIAEEQASLTSWDRAIDRMGGQVTEEEIYRAARGGYQQGEL
jgi:hypothetical protein